MTLHELQIRIFIDGVVDRFHVTVREPMDHNTRMPAARAPNTWTSTVRTYRLIVLALVGTLWVTLIQRDVAVRRVVALPNELSRSNFHTDRIASVRWRHR